MLPNVPINDAEFPDSDSTEKFTLADIQKMSEAEIKALIAQHPQYLPLIKNLKSRGRG